MQNLDKGVMRLKVIITIISKALFFFHSFKMTNRARKCEAHLFLMNELLPLVHDAATEAKEAALLCGQMRGRWNPKFEGNPQKLMPVIFCCPLLSTWQNTQAQRHLLRRSWVASAFSLIKKLGWWLEVGR